MKEKLVAKVDAHIAMLLDKPELTNEEYHIIYERLREIRWAEVADVTLRAEPRRGRTGGSAIFIISSSGGETIQVIRNARTQAMLRRYSPVPIPE